jgi:hypothetical protein
MSQVTCELLIELMQLHDIATSSPQRDRSYGVRLEAPTTSPMVTVSTKLGRFKHIYQPCARRHIPGKAPYRRKQFSAFRIVFKPNAD